jgi:hypothetical protein
MNPWFGKKKTPDGTVIIGHDAVETQIGFTDKNTADFIQARETAYEKLFGKALSVSHELLPLIPHIDVYIFKRSQGDKVVYSLVTGEMGDLEMTLPRRAKDVPRRVELIFYCAEPREEYILRRCGGWRIPRTIASHGLVTAIRRRTEILPRHFGGALNWTRSCSCRRSS